MNELISLVTSRVGLPQDKASLAVNVVLGYLKDKLPAPLASQVENYLSPGTGEAAEGAAAGAGEGEGGFLSGIGKKLGL